MVTAPSPRGREPIRWDHLRVPLSTQAARPLPTGPPPEAGLVFARLLREAPACGAPVGHLGGKPQAHSAWSPHGETTGGVPCASWPGSGGLPARQVLGVLSGNQAWLVFTCGALVWGLHLRLSTLPLRPAGGSAHGRAASTHTREVGHVACVLVPSQTLCRPLGSQCGRPAIWFLNISIFVGVHEYFINFI